MLSAKRHQHPAILTWFLVLGWRPSFRFKSRAPCPLRPAAGLLLDVRIEHGVFCVMLLCITGFETVKRRFPNDDAKTRAERRACTSKQAQRRMLCFSMS